MQYTLFTIQQNVLVERICTFEEFATTTTCKFSQPINYDRAHLVFDRFCDQLGQRIEIEERDRGSFSFIWTKGVGLFMVYDDEYFWSRNDLEK